MKLRLFGAKADKAEGVEAAPKVSLAGQGMPDGAVAR
jgi:hypothetical protein